MYQEDPDYAMRLVFGSSQPSNSFTVGAASGPTSASKTSGIPDRGGDGCVVGVAGWRLPWGVFAS